LISSVRRQLDRVLKRVQGLQPGQWVRVDWYDAATLRDVSAGEDPHRVAIATLVETPGRFLGVFRDELNHIPHLLLAVERMGDRETWVSIPLAMVLNIVQLTEKEAMRLSRRSVRRRIGPVNGKLTRREVRHRIGAAK